MLLSTASKLYAGGSAISKVYAGTTLVWQPPVAQTGFADTFNRADANLESSVVASGGWSWTWDGLFPGTTNIVSNQLKLDLTQSSPAGFMTPALSSLDQYVQYTAVNLLGSGASFICCRMTDGANYVAVRTAAAVVQLFRKVGGGFVQIGASGNVLTVGCTVRLEVEGSNARVLVNGVQVIAPTAIGATFTSLKAGISPRAAAGMIIDNFEAGVL